MFWLNKYSMYYLVYVKKVGQKKLAHWKETSYVNFSEIFCLLSLKGYQGISSTPTWNFESLKKAFNYLNKKANLA